MKPIFEQILDLQPRFLVTKDRREVGRVVWLPHYAPAARLSLQLTVTEFFLKLSVFNFIALRIPDLKILLRWLGYL